MRPPVLYGRHGFGERSDGPPAGGPAGRCPSPAGGALAGVRDTPRVSDTSATACQPQRLGGAFGDIYMSDVSAPTQKPTRNLEWWLAGFTCFYGVWLLVMPGSMDMPGYAVIRYWMEPSWWGVAAVLVGGVHLSALMTNEMWLWSPLCRATAAALNSFFFGILGTGFAKADASSVSVAIYLFGLSIAGLIVFGIAWRDCTRLYCSKGRKGGP